MYAIATAALLSVSLLTLSWWAWSIQRTHRHAFYIALSVVSLLAAAVGWLSVTRVPIIWPGGIVLVLIIDWFIFSRSPKELPAKRRRALTVYSIVASMLAVGLSIRLVYFANRSTADQTTISNALQQQEHADSQSLSTLSANPSAAALQNVAVTRQLDLVASLDSQGTVTASNGNTPPIGANFWAILPYLSTHAGSAVSGIAELPSRQIAEVVTQPTTSGELVGLHYLTPSFLGQLNLSVGWALYSQSGVTAAAPNTIESPIWDAVSFTSWLSALKPTGLTQKILQVSGSNYTVTVWPLNTLTGSIDAVTLRHA